MTLSDQLVMPFVQLNWDPQERYPLVMFEIPERPGENVEGDAPTADDPSGDGELNRSRPSLNAVDAGTEDDLAGDYLKNWRPQMAPFRQDLDALLRDASSPEDALDRLPGLMRTWAERDHRFIDALGEATFLASGLGSR